MLLTGLENDVVKLKRAGPRAIGVATIGVAAPFILGALVVDVLRPEDPWVTKLFAGATLTATSIGVSAYVLKELGIMQSLLAQILIAAAVIDDVLGLTILTVAENLIKSGTVDFAALALILFKSIGFIYITIAFGERISHLVFGSLSRFNEWVGMKKHGEINTPILLEGSIIVCVIFIAVAQLLGMHYVIGAFAGGLVLSPHHYSKSELRRQSEGEEYEERMKRKLLHGLERFSDLFTSVFFVGIGAMIDISILFNSGTWMLGLAITVAAVIGKLISGVLIRDREVDRAGIGLGMIPRGEVGTVFLDVGSKSMHGGQAVLAGTVFGALMLMIMLTTLLGPLLFSSRLRAVQKRASEPVVG